MAVGCIGMTVDDFCQCTPSEFQAVYESWNDAEQRKERAAWERARLQCTCMLQPYSKRKLEPRDVFRFEWEDKGIDPDDGENLTTKEIWERFEKAKMEQGLQ